MGLKLFGPKKIFDTQAVAGVAAYRSSIVDMLCMDTGSMEIQWSGTPTGVLSLDVSNYIAPDGTIVWYPTGQDIHNPAGAGAADSTFIDLSRSSGRYFSLSYTNAGGAGTLTVISMAKGLGG